MNYAFMRRCVEKRKFAPIQQDWLDSIDSLIPDQFKMCPEASRLLQELYARVTDQYRQVVVKHSGILDG